MRRQGRTAIQSVGRWYVYRKHAEGRCWRRGFIFGFQFCRTPENLSSVVGGVRNTNNFSETSDRMVHIFQTTARKLLTGSHPDSQSRRRWMTLYDVLVTCSEKAETLSWHFPRPIHFAGEHAQYCPRLRKLEESVWRPRAKEKTKRQSIRSQFRTLMPWYKLRCRRGANASIWIVSKWWSGVHHLLPTCHVDYMWKSG